MRIGLVRHFAVQRPWMTDKWMNSKEFNEYSKEYDILDVNSKEVDLTDIEWQKCFCSDLPRAVTTAKAIYKGEIEIKEILREIPVASVLRTSIRLPFLFWDMAGRLAWLFCLASQTENREISSRRVKSIVSMLIAQTEKDVLVVSHAALMFLLRQELAKMGFKGPKFNNAQNGVLYIYEKDNL